MYARHKELINWMFLKTKINENFRNSSHFFPRRAIVNVHFGENIGYEKCGTRPAIIVSNDMNNKQNGNVVVVPLTDASNKPGKMLPM
ncbi:type II toxin-antitoxin system PemK/MazF family toxin [Bacillaceae bacterium W0354]